MSEQFPMEFTLSSGTHVVVNRAGDNSFDFLLRPTNGAENNFTYVEDERPKTEWDESLEFEQLDALRTFWLKTEDVV